MSELLPFIRFEPCFYSKKERKDKQMKKKKKFSATTKLLKSHNLLCWDVNCGWHDSICNLFGLPHDVIIMYQSQRTSKLYFSHAQISSATHTINVFGKIFSKFTQKCQQNSSYKTLSFIETFLTSCWMCVFRALPPVV